MPVTVAVATALAIPLGLPAQAAEPAPPKTWAAQTWKGLPKPAPAQPSAIPVRDRTRTLGPRYKASQDTAWNGTGSTTIVPHWSFKGSLDGVPTASGLTAERDELTVRCDNTVPNAGTGCVFSHYKPTYVLNSKMFPGAAAHIAFMWNKTKIIYGRNTTGGKPLTYLGDKLADDGSGKPQKDRNRAKICGSTFKKYPGTGDFSDLWGKPDGISCDEFVFANAYQSAGTPLSNGGTNPVTKNGKECIQTYIKRNADDTSSIHLRPDAPQPTYNEPCGRSSMSTWQNTQSMQPFGTFIGRQRLQQDDNYWVDLDGFVLS